MVSLRLHVKTCLKQKSLTLCLLVADGRHVHPGVQVLLSENGPSASSSGPKRAVQHSRGHRCLGAGLRGADLSRQRR